MSNESSPAPSASLASNGSPAKPKYQFTITSLLYSILNLLGLPGVGTFLAGHRILGAIQFFLNIFLLGVLLGFIYVCWGGPALEAIMQARELLHTQGPGAFAEAQGMMARALIGDSPEVMVERFPYIMAMMITCVLIIVNILWSAASTRIKVKTRGVFLSRSSKETFAFSPKPRHH